MLIKRTLLFLLMLLLPLQLFALEPPQLKGRVNDYAAMLSPETISKLEKKLAAFEREQSTQVVVLTIPSLQGDNIDRYSIAVAEKWKIGQAGKDNGVILLLAKQERKVRIEVGMGLQGVLPDVTASRIIRDVMRPYLKDNNFNKGISAGVDAILSATKGEFKASSKTPAQGHPVKSSKRPAIFSFILLLLATAVGAVALGYVSRMLSGVAGAAGVSAASAFCFHGLSPLLLGVLGLVGFGAGLLCYYVFTALIKGGGGGGSSYGGWGGGGYYGGGGFYGGGSSGDSGDFSGGGGDFDGGGSSDDY